MSLQAVTITGADDQTDPSALVNLGAEFPFVEWGILFSPQRRGKPRYPSANWVRRLPPLRLSAHFCGLAARETMNGDGKWLNCLPEKGFGRVQINGYQPHQPPGVMGGLSKEWAMEFILQCRSESELQETATQAACLRRASVLFDPSGGRGIEAFRWPLPPANTRLGYAGGIKPETIEDVIGAIGPEAGDYWIDMESGVRDQNDQFDLARVRLALERLAAFVKVEAP